MNYSERKWTILNDFELSNEFFKDQIAYMEAAAKKKTDDEEVIETVKNLTGVSRSYMERMISYLMLSSRL